MDETNKFLIYHELCIYYILKKEEHVKHTASSETIFLAVCSSESYTKHRENLHNMQYAYCILQKLYEQYGSMLFWTQPMTVVGNGDAQQAFVRQVSANPQLFLIGHRA